MQIENPELKSLLKSMPEDERRIAELFAQAMGESHVLNCLKKIKECPSIPGESVGEKGQA
jgi:hypothetical protein